MREASRESARERLRGADRVKVHRALPEATHAVHGIPQTEPGIKLELKG